MSVQVLRRELIERDAVLETRASFWVYNDRSDIDALIDALERARALFGFAGV